MYNDIVDAGTVVKTAAEVQAEVANLLQRIGTSKAFADRIAAAYGATSKAGNDLHARLEQEVASLPPGSPPAGLKPSLAMMDAAAETVDVESHLFSMRDTTKPGIDVLGEVTGGELVFMVRAVVRDTGERGTLGGRYMFERMLDHFRAQGTAINAIQGNWTYESNLGMFNRLSRVGLTDEEAAAGTITGEWAAQQGYSRVTDVFVDPPNAQPGAYARVTAKFRQ